MAIVKTYFTETELNFRMLVSRTQDVLQYTREECPEFFRDPNDPSNFHNLIATVAAFFAIAVDGYYTSGQLDELMDILIIRLREHNRLRVH